MKEHPILFNPEMVKAILDDRKTQTRRVIKHQPPTPEYKMFTLMDSTNSEDRRNIGRHHWSLSRDCQMIDGSQPYFSCPYGQVGDRLWLQESYQIINYDTQDNTVSGLYKSDCKAFVNIELTGDEFNKFQSRKFPFRSTPGRFMYKSLSRITLEITNIRVERVQDIDDALAEGIRFLKRDKYGQQDFYGLSEDNYDVMMPSARSSFVLLWNSINKKSGFEWGVNPWVWVVEFKRI